MITSLLCLPRVYAMWASGPGTATMPRTQRCWTSALGVQTPLFRAVSISAFVRVIDTGTLSAYHSPRQRLAQPLTPGSTSLTERSRTLGSWATVIFTGGFNESLQTYTNEASLTSSNVFSDREPNGLVQSTSGSDCGVALQRCWRVFSRNCSN